jgi:hypothetical protein
MDSEQIQQQMRIRRAAIDAKLDLLVDATATARCRGVPALIAIATTAAIMLWVRRRSARKAVPRHSKSLLRAG